MSHCVNRVFYEEEFISSRLCNFLKSLFVKDNDDDDDNEVLVSFGGLENRTSKMM